MMQRWLRAVKWRLQNVNLPIWVPIDEDEEIECPREMELGNGRWKRIWWRWSNRIKGYIPTTRLRATESDSSDLMMRDPKWRGQRGRMRLNLRALGEAQLQAAAMEAGAPLQDILPQHPNHLDHYGHHDYNLDGGPEPISPTHHRLGRMIAVLGNFAYAVSAGQTPSRQEFDEGGDQSNDGIFPPLGRHTGSISAELTVAELEQEEKRMSTIRLAIAFTLFFTFWLVSCPNIQVTAETELFWFLRSARQSLPQQKNGPMGCLCIFVRLFLTLFIAKLLLIPVCRLHHLYNSRLWYDLS